MNSRFRFDGRFIIVSVRVEGPTGSLRLLFALDTGASTTVVDERILGRLGYAPAAHEARVVTPTGVSRVGGQVVSALESLGVIRRDIPVLSIALPREAAVNGLLGLDFIARSRLTIDFASRTINFEPS